jgi:hypothetical protein
MVKINITQKSVVLRGKFKFRMENNTIQGNMRVSGRKRRHNVAK